MRVLVTPEWYPWSDQPGFGSFCREQALVASRSHDVVVLTWRAVTGLRAPFALSDSNEDGLRTLRVRFRHVPLPRFGGVCRLLGVAAALRRLRSAGWIPDVVHAHEYAAGVPATIAASISEAPLIISEHASDLARGTVTPAQKACARRAFHRAVVVCPVSADFAARLGTLVDDTCVIPVPNAVDTSSFHPGTREPHDHIRLLTVGNLVEVKGHCHLLDALRIVVDHGLAATLDVVGDGCRRRELECQARRLGLETTITFHGHVPKERVSEMMRSADVFVLPSLWETMSCALAEAIASGVPCVATRVGGTQEVVDSRTGVLVAPGSPAALAEGVATIVRERQRFRADTLHSIAAEKFGYDAVGKRWTEIYASARAAHTRPRWASRGEAAHA